MKKLLSISMLAVTLFTTAIFANAAPAAKSEPQLYEQQQRRGQRNDRWNRDRRTRTVTQTRVVRSGRRVYRETIQIRYQNGRTTTRVISRVRIR